VRGVQDPYCLRTGSPLSLLSYSIAGCGLVGRECDGMTLVRVFYFRLGTEKEGLLEFQELFTQPEWAEVLFP
jgi:hypothetical protein